jgi:murein L,D-transpeptidase YcbB/YkuD
MLKMKNGNIYGFKFLICYIVLCIIFFSSPATPFYKNDTLQNHILINPELTAKFYKLNSGKIFWFTSQTASVTLRYTLKQQIDSCINIGLDAVKYHYDEIIRLMDTNYSVIDSVKAMNADRIFTDAAIALCKDIYRGKNISSYINYDEVSRKYLNKDDEYLINSLLTLRNGNSLSVFILTLEPNQKEYLILKNEIKQQLQQQSLLKIKQLSVALNYYRWIHHFKFEKYIIINIPSATLKYYQSDTIALQMKVIVGKSATKTPRFAAYCNQVIMYPYWNVPASIAVNELLPKIKRNPSVLDAMNMQVVDANGNVLNHKKMNWYLYSKNYFPYRLRQSTGCDNSLGVIKFNITDPFSVYLHDTNNKTAFLSGARFYSHGCIRLEQPIELANLLLNNQLDTDFLKSCYLKQEPLQINLVKPVAVFVIYSLVDTDAAKSVKFYKDVYRLFK